MKKMIPPFVLSPSKDERKLLAAFASLLLCASAQAQEDYSYARRLYNNKAQCQYCHGWAGDGAGDGQAGAAPSLRVTRLNREQLIQVIQCGRPGTPMPRFDDQAYVDKRCYNVTEAELGSRTPQLPPGSPLTQREIDAVADFILAKFKGRDKITREECEETFGKGSRACSDYGALP